MGYGLKMGIWFRWVDKMDVYFLEKCDDLSESVAFGQNWDMIQTRMDQRGDHIHYLMVPLYSILVWFGQSIILF